MDALREACHVAGAALAGQRLDAALAVVLEALGQPVPGLRGRRRLLEEGRVRVNGRQAPAAYRVRQGDGICLSPALPELFPDPAAGVDLPRALSRQGRWQAFFKPAGWHSVSLAGGSGRSLEAAIPSLWPGGGGPAAWALLQRLDARTSGIVCAAVADDADSLAATVRDFRRAEAGGRCRKGYLALLSGGLERAACVRLALDMAQRRGVRVLDAETADATRWTWFRPLYRWQGEACRAFARRLCLRFSLSVPSLPHSLTLAGCTIHRGARHQIRAHAAALGHALWLDGLYGPSSLPQSPVDGQGAFFLHHGALHLPEARWMLPPDWLPEGEIATAGRKWLENDFMDTV